MAQIPYHYKESHEKLEAKQTRYGSTFPGSELIFI